MSLFPKQRVLYAGLLCASLACAQQVTVTARVALVGRTSRGKVQAPANVVLWLAPAGGSLAPNVPQPTPYPRLIQKNKSFEPHVLAVPVGSVVAFPNHDPFFHNVFSLFEGKRFDLGLYEAGSTRDVNFDKPGVSYIFCNIHPEMSAVVMALESPYYGVSDPRGQIVISGVPAGRYTMHVWYEGALPETLRTLVREISVSESNSSLGVLRLPEGGPPQPHKNLYGQDYPPPAPDSPAYERR